MAPVEWTVLDGLAPYLPTVEAMEARAAAIAAGTAPDAVWLVEHPPLYTAGTSARSHDLLKPDRLPVYVTGRGGQYTYHGPGQRIAYVMLDLRERGRDVRAFVHGLEAWIIETLGGFAVTGERREGRVGVWVPQPGGGEDKIAAIGVRVRRWVSFHGVALNVSPNLSDYAGIVPCGVSGHGVTSLEREGVDVALCEVDDMLRRAFVKQFGATAEPSHAPPPADGHVAPQ